MTGEGEQQLTEAEREEINRLWQGVSRNAQGNVKIEERLGAIKDMLEHAKSERASQNESVRRLEQKLNNGVTEHLAHIEEDISELKTSAAGCLDVERYERDREHDAELRDAETDAPAEGEESPRARKKWRLEILAFGVIPTMVVAGPWVRGLLERLGALIWGE